jgi:predicted O-linked N-acetylglucosamine transferase (SPINDLY family)
VLWLIGDSRLAESNLRREAETRGINPGRLVFAPRCDMPDHLARQKLADLMLDSFPYGAHTTTSDALWVGVPVLTLAGETFASRVAGSLLRSVGLAEMITTTRPEYEELAVRLAQRPVELKAIRDKLAANLPSAPLFDTPRLARHIEAAYETMWAAFAEGNKPEHIRIEP